MWCLCLILPLILSASWICLLVSLKNAISASECSDDTWLVRYLLWWHWGERIDQSWCSRSLHISLFLLLGVNRLRTCRKPAEGAGQWQHTSDTDAGNDSEVRRLVSESLTSLMRLTCTKFLWPWQTLLAAGNETDVRWRWKGGTFSGAGFCSSKQKRDFHL